MLTVDLAHHCINLNTYRSLYRNVVPEIRKIRKTIERKFDIVFTFYILWFDRLNTKGCINLNYSIKNDGQIWQKKTHIYVDLAQLTFCVCAWFIFRLLLYWHAKWKHKECQQMKSSPTDHFLADGQMKWRKPHFSAILVFF